MFSQPFIEFVVGSITILGGLVLLLHKLDLIRFGKSRKEITLDKAMKECPAHAGLERKLEGIHSQQTLNITLHAQHAQKLKEGRVEFKEMKEALQVIGENIAVLLDRSNRAERLRRDDISLG